MPYRRKDSPIWWASYTDPRGRRARRSTGTADRAEAAALEGKWRAESHQARQWGSHEHHTFEALMLAWLAHAKATKRPSGYARDLDATRHLRRKLAGLDIAQITPAAIRNYIAARRASGPADATIARELAVLRAALRYARSELEWDAPDPVAGRAPPPSPGRLRWITRDEAERLIAEAGRDPQAAHLPDLIRLALHTGMRKGELLGLEWARVDFGHRLIYLEPHHTKTATRRAVPINAGAWQALRSLWDWRADSAPQSPWVFAHGQGPRHGERIRDIKTGFRGACRRASITDLRFHDLRHTCASWLIQSGASLQEVAQILGHTTIRMAERYAHLAPESARTALARLDCADDHPTNGKDLACI